SPGGTPFFGLRLSLRLPQYRFKLLDIGGKSDGIEKYLRTIGDDNGSCGNAGRFQLAAQRVEGDAEVGAGRFQRAGRPEPLEQTVARMITRSVKCQVGEQRSRFSGSKARYLSIALLHSKPAQHLYMKQSIHRVEVSESVSHRPGCRSLR